MKKWDVIIKNGQVFDGSGELPSMVDIATIADIKGLV